MDPRLPSASCEIVKRLGGREYLNALDSFQRRATQIHTSPLGSRIAGILYYSLLRFSKLLNATIDSQDWLCILVLAVLRQSLNRAEAYDMIPAENPKMVKLPRCVILLTEGTVCIVSLRPPLLNGGSLLGFFPLLWSLFVNQFTASRVRQRELD